MVQIRSPRSFPAGFNSREAFVLVADGPIRD